MAILGALVNECTRHLDLSYTELRGKAAGLAIGRVLRCHTIALQHLNVEHNNLGRHGINEVLVGSACSRASITPNFGTIYCRNGIFNFIESCLRKCMYVVL